MNIFTNLTKGATKFSKRFLRYTQTQSSQNIIFGKTFSRSKLLFQILPLNRTLLQLLQGKSFPRTRYTTISTCKTLLMILSTRQTTRKTRFSTRSTCLSIRLSTRSTRFLLIVLVCSPVVSICPLVVLVWPFVCPLVVLVGLSVSLFYSWSLYFKIERFRKKYRSIICQQTWVIRTTVTKKPWTCSLEIF